jgi:DNA-binding transcriptional regulator YiaG
MPLELRPEPNGNHGRSKKITGVYVDRRRVGEIVNFGSMAVFKSGEESRSFPSDSDARKWIEVAYAASQQGPGHKPDTRPTASAAPPPPSAARLSSPKPAPKPEPAPKDTRPAFPADADDIERVIYSMMRDCGDLEVTPPDTNLPIMTLDDILWAGANDLLGRDPKNGGVVLQAKRVLVNAVIRQMGHYLPPDFDQTARRNQLLKQNAAAARERHRTEPAPIAQALLKAIGIKTETAPPESPPESHIEQSDQPDYDYPDAVFSRSDVADLFEEAELAAESPPKTPLKPPQNPEPTLSTYKEVARLAAAPQPEKPTPRVKGGRGPHAKFDLKETKEIRAKLWHGASEDELAKAYNTSVPTVRRIAEGTYVPRPEA